jgi:hypothetical protein
MKKWPYPADRHIKDRRRQSKGCICPEHLYIYMDGRKSEDRVRSSIAIFENNELTH